jgi:protein TonB
MSQIYGTMHRLTLFLAAYFICAMLVPAQNFAAPGPYGGKAAVGWMLDQEMHFPPEALAAGLKGEVVVSFKVLADGTAKDIHVTLPLDPRCDAEAVRLVKLIRWMPASVGGTPLDTDHSITIPFNAKRYRKLHAKATLCERPPSPLPDDDSNTLHTAKDLDSLAVPMVPDGLRGLSNYLTSNLNYPSEAFRLDIQGKVTIEFVVETSGTISNLRTLDFLGGGCDAEAMRLARSICWVPAVKDGKHVRSIMKLDILFRLNPSLR